MVQWWWKQQHPLSSRLPKNTSELTIPGAAVASVTATWAAGTNHVPQISLFFLFSPPNSQLWSSLAVTSIPRSQCPHPGWFLLFRPQLLRKDVTVLGTWGPLAPPGWPGLSHLGPRALAPLAPDIMRATPAPAPGSLPPSFRGVHLSFPWRHRPPCKLVWSDRFSSFLKKIHFVIVFWRGGVVPLPFSRPESLCACRESLVWVSQRGLHSAVPRVCRCAGARLQLVSFSFCFLS